MALSMPTSAQWYFPTTGSGGLEGATLHASNGGGQNYIIDWGDGTSGTYAPNNNNGLDLDTGHDWAADGTYRVSVRAPGHGYAFLTATIDLNGGSSVSGSSALPNFVDTGGITAVATGSAPDLINAHLGGDISTGGGDDAIYLLDTVSFASVHAGDGSDVVYGSGLHVGVRLDMGDGDDDVFAGSGDDSIFGGAGDDFILSGGGGNDIIKGGAGQDGISGDAGVDRLYGGADADVFRFYTGDTGVGAARDQILDFEQGLDTIQLINDGANSFIGTAHFNGAAGQFRYVNAGAFTIIQADTDGDKHADFEIALKGTFALTNADVFAVNQNA